MDSLAAQNSHLISKIESLEQALHSERANQHQLASIRQNLEQEKELDILTLKKELLLQKERELREIRDAMSREKDGLGRQYQIMFQEEKERFEKEVERIRAGQKREVASCENQTDEVVVVPRDLITEIASALPGADSNTRDFASIASAIRSIVTDSAALKSELETTKALQQELDEKFSATLDIHANEIRCQREAYERKCQDLLTQLDDLRTTNSKLEREKQEPKSFDMFALSFNSVRRMYPEHVARLETEIRTEFTQKMDQLDQVHREETERLTKEFKENQERLKQACREEIDKISVTLKDQCSNAYTVAVEKMRLEFQKKMDEKEDENSVLQRRLEEASSSVFTTREVESLKDRARRLENALQDKQDEHAKIISDLKQKYILTLKKMRDDIVESKKRSSERLEREWSKRKTSLEATFTLQYVSLISFD